VRPEPGKAKAGSRHKPQCASSVWAWPSGRALPDAEHRPSHWPEPPSRTKADAGAINADQSANALMQEAKTLRQSEERKNRIVSRF